MVKSLHVNPSKRRRRKRFLCLRNASSMQGGAFKYKGKKKDIGVWLYNRQKLYMLKATQVWRVHEVGPHSQISSKRLDHIPNSRPRGWITFTKSHPKGWTTLTNLIQEYFIHVWSWNYDYLDKGRYDHFGTFFFDKCAHEVVQHLLLFDLCLHEVVLLDCRNSSKWGWWWGFYVFLKEHREN